MSNQINIQHSSATNEHYTPVEITQLYAQLIGRQIDLDPFSCEKANQLVNAAVYYSKENEQNGKQKAGAKECFNVSTYENQLLSFK